MYDKIKQDVATAAEHSKQIIELLKKCNVITTNKSTIWYDKYDFAEQYIRATYLYLLSMLLQAFNIISFCSVSAPLHGNEVVYGLNATDKRFIFNLMTTLQLPGSQRFDT